MNITDVRKALWEAYKAQEATEYGIEGKTSEAYCEVFYPTYWDCETLEQFQEPDGIMVYSYALGPSRRHYFHKSDKETNPDYRTWHTKDIYSKAVEVIKSWEIN